MNYKGLHSSKRKILATILAQEKGVISVDAVVNILKWDRKKVRELLSSFFRAGWLKSVKRGFYIPVPLEATDGDATYENPFVLASYLYRECYIGSWSAASFWGFTDQLFRKVWVITKKPIRHKEETRSHHEYILRHTSPSYFYGLYTEVIGHDRVYISDPHKTVIDFANFIDEYGLQSFVDVFSEYLRSEHKNLDLLLDYAKKSKNKTVFKRIGFMLEKSSPNDKKFIDLCLKNIGKSVTYFSPHSQCEIFSSKWNLWIPNSMTSQ